MNKSEISNYYNIISRSYDELYGDEQLSKYIITLSSKLINLNNMKNILDIGCGTGLLAKYLAKMIGSENIHYIGIEISYLLLRKANQNYENILVDYILTDGEDPPIRVQSIDLITLYTVAHHFQDPIESIVRLIKKGGKSIIATFLSEKEKFINNLLSKIQDEIGFDFKSEVYNYRNKEIMLVFSLL